MTAASAPTCLTATVPESLPPSLRFASPHGKRSNSEILRTKIELTCGDLGRALSLLWHHPDPSDRFPRFLVLLHQIMRASVPLMQEALAMARGRIGSDPTAAPLVSYLTTHLAEEVDHDIWTLEDLEAAGFDGTAAGAQMPSPDLAAMVGAQYYWIRHHHPLALLGYIAILEGNPPGSAHIDRLRRLTGLPDEAFRTYRLHGNLDPHHRQDLWDTIDALPLTRGDAALIALSACHTARALAACLDGLDAVALPPRRSGAELLP